MKEKTERNYGNIWRSHVIFEMLDNLIIYMTFSCTFTKISKYKVCKTISSTTAIWIVL